MSTNDNNTSNMDKRLLRSSRLQSQQQQQTQQHQQHSQQDQQQNNNLRQLPTNDANQLPVHSSSSSSLFLSHLSSLSSSSSRAALKNFEQNFVLLESSLMTGFSSLLDEKLESLRTSFHEMIDKKIDALKTQLQVFNEDFAELDNRVNEVENSQSTILSSIQELKRKERLSDVVITGIPYVENENPTELYKSIANILKVNVSPFVHAFRLKVKTRSSSKNFKKYGPVLVKMSCPAERIAFFNALKNLKRKMCLSELNCGFSSNSKLGFYESLLPEDDIIRKHAYKLRKDNKLSSVFMLKGVVHVRRSKNDLPIKIFSVQQLNTLLSTSDSDSSSRNRLLSDGSDCTVVHKHNS